MSKFLQSFRGFLLHHFGVISARPVVIGLPFL